MKVENIIMWPYPLFGDYVYLYGVCIAIGIFLCIMLLRYLGKKLKVDPKFLDFVEILGYCVIAFGFLTSWLFQVIYEFIETGKWNFTNSGITFLGGLLGGVGSFIIVYYIFKKKNKLTGRITDILPFVPCVITIAHGFGRIGCFFAGCCYGRIAEPNEFFYFLAMEAIKPSGLRYPVQLLEAIFLLLLCGIMLILLLKKKFKYNFVIYLASYGIWRYLIEFVRDDDRGQIIKGVNWLSPSQFWSLLMVIGSIPVFFLLKKLYSLRDEELLTSSPIVTNNEDIETL